jgi:hypothetical protein
MIFQLPNIGKKGRPSVSKKPKVTQPIESKNIILKPIEGYPTLVAQVLYTQEDKRMTLQDIYNSIQNKYPYFQALQEDSGWKSSIRNALSNIKYFKKVPSEEMDGKRAVYELDMDNIDEILNISKKRKIDLVHENNEDDLLREEKKIKLSQNIENIENKIIQDSNKIIEEKDNIINDKIKE